MKAMWQYGTGKTCAKKQVNRAPVREFEKKVPGVV